MDGSSLGGVISSYAGLLQPLVWGRIGAMSPSTWWDDKYLIGAVQGSQGAPARPALVYLDCGDSGPSNDGVDDTRVLAQTYQAIGYVEGVDFHFVVGAGDQHNEHDWSRRFPGAMRFLLGKRR
jgi:predicted alpha/beta superfamily hydrolase